MMRGVRAERHDPMATLHSTRTAVPELEDPLLVLERMEEGFYAIDNDWRFQHVNGSAERFWGRSRDELLGRSMLSLFPRFQGSPPYQAHVRAKETQQPARVEAISTVTGAPVELRLFPGPGGLSVYLHDITWRRAMERDLQTRDELLTLAEESAGIGVWVGDLESGTVVATPQYFHLLGVDPVKGPIPQEYPRRFMHPEDRKRIASGLRDALERGEHTFDCEYRIIRPSGEQRWIFGRGRITRDEKGRPWRFSGVDIDVTERKAKDGHLRMVMRELLHRTNNLLAVVQGLARQTAAHSGDLEDFLQAFDARLRGLGQSSALLARQEWRGAPLADLIRGQISSFAEEGRFELEGPDIMLPSKAAQNLGLAFHELSTNAIKYGALSTPTGRVEVSWRVREEGTGHWLRLSWRERGGPPVEPPERVGFGRVVSEQMLASALGAAVSTDFDPAGIEWVLELPEGQFTLVAAK